MPYNCSCPCSQPASLDAMKNDSTVATQSRTQTHAHSVAVICCSIAIDMPSPGAMQNDPTVATQSHTHRYRCSHLLQHCYRHAQSGRNAKRPDCCNTITHTPIPMQSSAAALLSTCPVRAQCKTTRLLQHNHTHTDTDAVICCSIAIDMPSPGAMQNDCCNTSAFHYNSSRTPVYVSQCFYEYIYTTISSLKARVIASLTSSWLTTVQPPSNGAINQLLHP